MIVVTKYRAMQESSLKAYFSITIDKWGDFFIKDMKLFEKNGHKFVNFPDQKYEKDGETKYSPYCGFAKREIKEAFEKEVLKAIEVFLSQSQKSDDQMQIPF